MSEPEVTHLLQRLNQRLQAGGIGLRIEARGGRLHLRGILPPRPGSDRLLPTQQRWPLGLPTTVDGVVAAEIQAKLLAVRLWEGRFRWEDRELKGPSLGDRLEAFAAHFWQTRGGDPRARATWEKAYAPYLRQLQQTAERYPHLAEGEWFYRTILNWPVASRSRQVGLTALRALQEFWPVDLPFTWEQVRGTYHPAQVRERHLPDEATIIAVYHRCPPGPWRRVYGLMATFGLRNHEVFFCDRRPLQEGENRVEVGLTTKTGRHQVWALPAEWVEEMDLRSGLLPQLRTDLRHTSLQRIGQQVTQQFRRMGVPFAPYDLRHAWAVRALRYGLPDAIAAQMMGHSLTIHNRTYQRWIAQRDQGAAMAAAWQQRQAELATRICSRKLPN
ncbi:MAG: site-specific integrase [Pseudanabaenaceae cyanobacterium]